MSATIEDKILLYPDLSYEERMEVDRYVADHPEWAPALAEARALDALVQDARSLLEEPLSDEALAFYAVTRELPDPPEEVASVLEEIHDRLETDPELARRLSEIEAQSSLLEQSSPADEQFARLTGRSLADEGENRATDEDQRGPEPRHIRYLWRAAAAIVVLAAAYSVLYKVGQTQLTEGERLARFDREELSVEGFSTVRNPERGTEPSSSAEAYLAALNVLQESQQSTLGLFPRFDTERLEQAETLLRSVLAREPKDSFLAGEASYLMAKVKLARGETAEAEILLQQVIDTRSRRAEDAQLLLQRLQE